MKMQDGWLQRVFRNKFISRTLNYTQHGETQIPFIAVVMLGIPTTAEKCFKGKSSGLMRAAPYTVRNPFSSSM